MNEKLRESLDTALMFQKLIETFREVVRQTTEQTPELNDGLLVLMMTAHNGLGNIAVKLYEQIELLNERIAVYGNGDGVPKQIAVTYTQDGKEDFTDEGEQPQDEWHASDAQDEDEMRDEWEVDEDD